MHSSAISKSQASCKILAFRVVRDELAKSHTQRTKGANDSKEATFIPCSLLRAASRGQGALIRHERTRCKQAYTTRQRRERGATLCMGSLSDREKPSTLETWSVEDGERLYKVNSWGAPYFGINLKGNVTVQPAGEEGPLIDIMDILELLETENIPLPAVIRFPEIMCHRLRHLQDCFDKAISAYGYQGRYQGVFPVKCNNDSSLLQTVINFGNSIRFGLEAGSKPELLLAICLLRNAHPEALLICNGYKDAEYVETVLLSSQLGTPAVLVLEKLEELPLIIQVSRRLRLQPRIGIRAKLSVRGDGHWGGTSGDEAKFGLAVSEVWRAVQYLKDQGMLHTLQLLHFHIGSQVAQIRTIKDAMREASHLYAELYALGAPMGALDVGGGLAVDYDGTMGDFLSLMRSSLPTFFPAGSSLLPQGMSRPLR
ncbi:hypothetical protein CYMTET_30699 [Cymbomonas tetramitiformis]|uniref:Arginine decarboxylase n=1 Tax=Cymbomonas tetramitiformis TaxID=36881 RepID=A0AAE0FIZ2_9CHLO|nr:hypothetical protein CYMTET_30699 [Cymbomonas tetramitiformis]